MNRGNCRMDVFQKPGDLAAFVTILEEGRQRVNPQLLGVLGYVEPITGQDGGACSKTGGGRVSAAAPFDKLTTALAWTGEA